MDWTSNAREIMAVYYGIRNFAEVFKETQSRAVLVRSDNATTVYNMSKWRARESLVEYIRRLFYLTKRLKL
jgi:ribonuclease HI